MKGRGWRGLLGLLLIAGVLGGIPSVSAQIPQSREQISLSFAPVVKEATPAVVNIFATRIVRTRHSFSPLARDPFFRRFFGEDFMLGMPRERAERSLGSGVIVDPEGIIVTNNHVIGGDEGRAAKSDIKVVLADRREFPAEVLATDERTDLAVLKIDTGGERLPFLGFRDSDDLEVGDLVLAIGNPFGVGQTVTSGIVSALARTQIGITDYSFFIQTDAAINPGNSGGALVGMDGRLVGINTAIYSRGGGSNGIGFAIPANMVRMVVDSALGSGRVERPFSGIGAQTVTAEIAGSLGLDRPQGVLVRDLYPGGPGERAGLQIGDVILRVDGREVNDPQALRYYLATRPVGERVTLTIRRRAITKNLRMTLIRPPENPPRNEKALSGRHPLDGVRVANLSPALAEELHLDSMERGVIVTAIDRRGAAARVGIRPGDILRKIQGREIARVRDLERQLRDAQRMWELELERDGKRLRVRVRG